MVYPSGYTHLLSCMCASCVSHLTIRDLFVLQTNGKVSVRTSEELWFTFRWRHPIFLHFEASRPSLEPTQTWPEGSNLVKNAYHEMKRDAMPLVNGYRHFGWTFRYHFQGPRRFNGDPRFLGFHFFGIWLVGNQISTCGLLKIRITRYLETSASDYPLVQGHVPEE